MRTSILSVLLLFPVAGTARELVLPHYALVSGRGEVVIVKHGKVEEKILTVNGKKLGFRSQYSQERMDRGWADYTAKLFYVRPMRGFNKRGVGVYRFADFSQLTFLPKVVDIWIPPNPDLAFISAGYLEYKSYLLHYDVDQIPPENNDAAPDYYKLLNSTNPSLASKYAGGAIAGGGCDGILWYLRENAGGNFKRGASESYYQAVFDCSASGDWIVDDYFKGSAGYEGPEYTLVRSDGSVGKPVRTLKTFQDIAECFAFGEHVEHILCPSDYSDKTWEYLNLVTGARREVVVDGKQFRKFDAFRFLGATADRRTVFFQAVLAESSSRLCILAFGDLTNYRLVPLALPAEIKVMYTVLVIDLGDS